MKGRFLSTISERLRAERERLGLSQVAFAAVGGAKKHSQINYEAGRTTPDGDYLAAIHAAGADILYILTGERGTSPAPLPSADELPPRLRARLADAISAVEEGLDALGREAAPPIKAALILAAYDILSREGEAATAQIIRLVKAA